MLTELTITDFAIIDRLELRLNPRFNVFTGETGSGKSIIIDAVSALLGGTRGVEVVRRGADRATIYGSFSVGELPTISQNGQHANNADHDGEAETLSTDQNADGAGEQDQADARLAMAQLLSEYGLEVDNGELIIGREIFKSGR
ncbi:MAG TPA: AAA family ATPase, partial [Ktedonobacterales bacterium]